MTNYSRGHEAEKVAADYLKRQGYKIIELNWRRPRAEIDIVARKKHEAVIFIEVKYRQNDQQGGGLDYITPKKLAQMQFAAELWCGEHRYDGDYALGALEMSGDDFVVTSFIESVT
ncbi:MAG: YraN family protein [Candidatus Saccharimonadales bacterium]